MNYKTDIIVPTWNSEDYTIRCFESINKNTKDFLLIWVDNGSKKESRKKVEDYIDKAGMPCKKIFNEENLGFVKATNQGMKYAMQQQVEYLVLQNNDTEVFEGWLDELIKVAQSQENIGIVGPLASPSHGWQDINNIYKKRPDEFPNPPKYNNNPEEYAEKIRKKYAGEKMEVYPNVAFFCTLVKRELVEKIGYLSEEFGIGFSDDDDYCARALEVGYKIYLAKNVFVFHNHRTTFKENFSEEEIKKMGEKNREILKEKHLHYKDLIDRRPKKIKELFSLLKKIKREEGMWASVKYLVRFTKYVLFNRKKSWL
jgi:GT2 family glycosyltransferase